MRHYVLRVKCVERLPRLPLPQKREDRKMRLEVVLDVGAKRQVKQLHGSWVGEGGAQKYGCC